MRRTAICSLPHVGSELRTARCRCGVLLGAVATEAHGIELRNDGERPRRVFRKRAVYDQGLRLFSTGRTLTSNSVSRSSSARIVAVAPADETAMPARSLRGSWV